MCWVSGKVVSSYKGKNKCGHTRYAHPLYTLLLVRANVPPPCVVLKGKDKEGPTPLIVLGHQQGGAYPSLCCITRQGRGGASQPPSLRWVERSQQGANPSLYCVERQGRGGRAPLLCFFKRNQRGGANPLRCVVSKGKDEAGKPPRCVMSKETCWRGYPPR